MDRAWGALEGSLQMECGSSQNPQIPRRQREGAGSVGQEGPGQLCTPCLQAGAHPGIRITGETLLVNTQKQTNDGRRELRIYSRVSSQVAECAMIDPQYICSGLLKIYLGSQEAACFYVNEETGLFGILLFFSNVSPDNVIEAGEQENNIHIPPPQAAWSLW